MDCISWLLESDPAIRWQAMRDLTAASPAAFAAGRARVTREGIGASILASQAPDGSWRRPNVPVWLPTLFTLLLLRSTGVDPGEPATASAIARLETNLRFDDQGGRWDLRPKGSGTTTFFDGEVEPCINGGVLALGAYFGRPSHTLATRLLADQLQDGGWNCDAPKSKVSSFHSTICVLEGLLEYERAGGGAPKIENARRRGEEYLLKRRLFRRLSTGEVVDPTFTRFAFPPRYHYDILRALDYFRAAGAPPDARMQEAMQILAGKRQPDGRWLLDEAYDEALAITCGESKGEPSRWNSLRALRVLRWGGHAPQ